MQPEIAKSGQDFFNRVREFMVTGGQTVDEPSVEQTGLYIGLIFEEVGEMVTNLSKGTVSVSERVRFQTVAALLEQFSDEFRKGLHSGDIMRSEAHKLLDDFVDTAVVAIGAVSSFSSSGEGAVNAVLSANEAKYPGGVVTRTPDGKVQKPEGWREADLVPFSPNFELD